MNTLNAEVSVYCPCCGNKTRSQSFALIGPGNCEWRCPECHEMYRVKIEFIPLKREPS